MRQDCPKLDLDGASQDEQLVLRVGRDTCEQLRDVYNTQSSDDVELHDEDSDGWMFIAPLVVAVWVATDAVVSSWGVWSARFFENVQGAPLHV